MHFRADFHVITNGLFEIVSADDRHHLTANPSAPFHHGYYGSLGALVSRFSRALERSPDKTFIRLHGATQLVREDGVFERVTNTVSHKQRRAIAAQFQGPLQIQGTHTLL